MINLFQTGEKANFQGKAIANAANRESKERRGKERMACRGVERRHFREHHWSPGLKGSGFFAHVNRIIYLYTFPQFSAFVNEPEVNGVFLVTIMVGLVPDDQKQGVCV